MPPSGCHRIRQYTKHRIRLRFLTSGACGLPAVPAYQPRPGTEPLAVGWSAKCSEPLSLRQEHLFQPSPRAMQAERATPTGAGPEQEEKATTTIRVPGTPITGMVAVAGTELPAAAEQGETTKATGGEAHLMGNPPCNHGKWEVAVVVESQRAGMEAVSWKFTPDPCSWTELSTLTGGAEIREETLPAAAEAEARSFFTWSSAASRTSPRSAGVV